MEEINVSEYISQIIILLNSYISNIALSVIAFSFLIRVFLFPSNISQTKFMLISKGLEPEISKIRATTKDRMEAENKVQALYKRSGVSPFGGLLYAILQITIMILTISSLRNASFVPENSEFLGWKLLESDSSYIFPAISSLLFIISTSRSGMKQSRFMSLAFAGLIFFVNMRWKVLLLLFFVSSSIFTILQDIVIKKYFIKDA